MRRFTRGRACPDGRADLPVAGYGHVARPVLRAPDGRAPLSVVLTTARAGRPAPRPVPRLDLARTCRRHVLATRRRGALPAPPPVPTEESTRRACSTRPGSMSGV